jgi:HlyD family secretion protein
VNKPINRDERMSIEKILEIGREAGHTLPDGNLARWISAAVAGLVVAIIAWAINGTTSRMLYVTEPAERGALIVLVTATGSVQPTNKVDVSSELSGTVRKVLVDYNSVVSANQPLALLDTDKLNATVASSRAKLAAAQAKVKDAEATLLEKQRDLQRKRLLAGKQVSSTQDLDVAQAAYDRALAGIASARADVGVAEAELKLNETNLDKASIVSPIAGVVLKRSVDPGQTVASSLQAPVLFSIAEDLTKMELQVDVDEADVGKVKAGQTATFSVDAYPDKRFPATIRDVRYASETIQGVVTYKAVLSVENSGLLLRPGMTATAEIRVLDIEEALLLPNAALRYSPPETAGRTDQRSFLQRLLPGPPRFRQSRTQEAGGDRRTVWVLDNGSPKAVTITTGATDGRRTEVKGGDLKPGQQLIVDQSTINS